VSSEPQRVSAAFTSGVNPKIADRCCLPLVAQHDRSEPCFSRSASGGASEDLATDDNVNPCGPVVDIAEALRAGWFELWYQPKIGSHAQDLRGAEALIRMRHPRLGIIQPADFMLDISDRRSLELSQFVIAQALADWRYFFTEQRPLEISINLPISFLGDPSSGVRPLLRQLDAMIRASRQVRPSAGEQDSTSRRAGSRRNERAHAGGNL
jgi:hypothetical protein